MDIPPNIEPRMQYISDSDRKRAKINEQFAGLIAFFSTISRGLMKIVEEITSLLIRR